MTDAPPLGDLAARDRFDVAVAILVVATTLVAACVGLLFADASNRAEQAASAAAHAALDASAIGLEADQRVDEALTRFQRAREQAARGRSALESHAFDERRGALAEARRWRRLAARSERSLRRVLQEGDDLRLDIGDESPLGPDRDPFFPFGLRAMAQQPAHVELADRDAANDLSAEWGQRTASYAAILTLLAVALYLFGFALAPQGRPLRGLFAAVGTAFLCLGLVFGPVRALSSPVRPPDSAAFDYAHGVAAVRASSEPRAFAAAADRLTRAIAARPDFVDAYAVRETARFHSGTPQVASSPSLTTPTALQGALEDVRMARSLGLRTSGNLSNEGFYLFVLAVRTHRPALLHEALALTRAAAEAQPDDTLVRFNLGVVLLASGRVEEARSEYRRALAELLLDPNPVPYASGALTDLELLADKGPIELADDVRDVKELIVGSLARKKVGAPRATVTRARIRAVVRPGGARVTVSEDVLDGGPLSVVWYHEEPGGLGWSSVEQLLVPLSEYSVVSTSYAAQAKRCLMSGRYRAEVYVGGRLVGSATTTYDGRGVAAVVDWDRSLAGCRPATWRERSGGSSLVRTFLSPDGRSGLHLMRLDHALHEVYDQQAIERVRKALVDAPAGPWRHVVSADLPTFGDLFVRHVYTYPGGRVHAAEAPLLDGSTVVAIVFGPAPDPAIAPEAILASLALTRSPVSE